MITAGSPSECTHLIKCGIVCTLFYLRFFVLICHRDSHNRVNVASRQLTALKHLDAYLQMKPSKINFISGLFFFFVLVRLTANQQRRQERRKFVYLTLKRENQFCTIFSTCFFRSMCISQPFSSYSQREIIIMAFIGNISPE